MSDLEQNGRQFSDAEYLEAMAKHFDGQIVPELREHAARLRAIATLQAQQANLLEALKELEDAASSSVMMKLPSLNDAPAIIKARKAIAKATGQS